MHRGDPESLGVSHNFPLFFFPPSFFPYLGFVQERNPWVRSLAHSHKYDSLNLPRGRKEAKRDDSASEVSSRPVGRRSCGCSWSLHFTVPRAALPSAPVPKERAAGGFHRIQGLRCRCVLFPAQGPTTVLEGIRPHLSSSPSSFVFAVILETLHPLPVSCLVGLCEITFKDHQASENFISFKTLAWPLTK